MSERARWIEQQRSLAEAMGLDLEAWVAELEAAAGRRTELLAAVIGAASARKKGLGIVRSVNGAELAAKARTWLLARRRTIEHPVLAEAVRRAGDIPRTGRSRFARRPERTPVRRPTRGAGSLGPSSSDLTPDAPGEDGDS